MRAMDSRLWAFVVVATLLAVTPGADTLLVVRNVLTRGRVAALLTVAGIAGGCIVLGVQSARRWWRGNDGAPASSDPRAAAVRPARRLRSFVEGLLTNVLNPKVGIFYLAFLPQFVGPGDPVLERSLLLAALHIGIGVVWLSVLTLGVGRIRPLVESRLWRARLEGVSGAVLIGLGVRLAAARR